MKYAILQDNSIASSGSAIELWPNTSFPGGTPNAEFLIEQSAVAIQSSLPFDAATQKLATVTPYIKDGVVYDVEVVELTQEEIDAALQAKRAAMSCTMRQARLALLQVGKLDEVDAAIAAMPEPEKSQAKIEWEYALSVDRASPFVTSLGGALGLTEDELDTLFELAVTL